ncbi:uncharacterized protein LOC116415911 [Nasonia vitripennis]|uniref:Uncharacterized protein n=1 Tax=Nasonia vitripennis TaxID=7425 RepID=A0A7M7PX19_NASVI|nr:uncharacterized protein LOC116415911 [Nasonia vitripennis]
MSQEKKKYLFSNAPFTNHARRKMRSTIKNTLFPNTDIPDATNNDLLENTDQLSDNEEDMNVEMSVDYGASRLLQVVTDTNDESDILSYSSDEELLKILEGNDNEDSNGFNKLFNDTNFFESLNLTVDSSPAELLLMSLKYSVSNKLSVTGILNLLKFVNRLCGKNILPESKYQFDQLCKNENTLTLHAVCLTCSMYIGTFEKSNKSVNCENCNSLIDVSNPSNACYFAIVNPSNAVRDYIESHENYYDYIVSERIHEPNVIKDIYDGECYKNFLNNLNTIDRHAYATAVFNTIGAPVFESSNVSIWPIYIMLNEIPIHKRLNSTIVTGLWFGTSKPEMSVFLDAFVESMNHLSTIGISATIKNQHRKIKLFTLLACVDTVARAPMNGTTLFNGKYGCDWCLHPGHYYGGSMRYPFNIPFPKERTTESVVEHAREAVRTQKRVFGVVNASPLINLKNFNIIDGFTPDYMHCFLAGVASQFTERILQHVTVPDIQYMDALLISIKAPHAIGRLSRPLSQRSNWKATEWENWLLFYSITVLNTVLTNRKIMQHWALLVESLSICLGTRITYSELNRANGMLYKFVSEVEDMYSLTAMTYNVHQLLHLVKSVHNWGPLWAHSTFPFEAANHKLLTAIHSAKGVVLQIIRYTNIQRTVQILENRLYPYCSKLVLDFCQQITSPLARKTLKISCITYFGCGNIVPPNIALLFNVAKTTLIFSKMVLNGCLYATSEKINKRSCNYYAQLTDETFIKILYFLVDTESKVESTVCEVIKTRPNKYANVVKEVTNISEKICVPTSFIVKPCIFIDTKDGMYIIPVPNVISH